MKQSGLIQTKRIGFFVEKNYFAQLLQLKGQELQIEQLEQSIIKHSQKPKDSHTPSLICKHLIGQRQALQLDKISESQAKERLQDQYIEDLFLAREYELTNKLNKSSDEELLQNYIQSSFAIKVLSEAINKRLDLVYLLVEKPLYDYLFGHIFQSLKSLGVEVRILNLNDDKTALSLDKTLEEKQEKQVLEPKEEKPQVEEQAKEEAPIQEETKEPEQEQVKEVETAPEQTTAEEEDSFKEGEEYIGEIANIVKNKGFAFIKRTPSNVFLYHSNMINAEQFYELEVGSQVIYQMERTNGGRIQAIKVFPLEA